MKRFTILAVLVIAAVVSSRANAGGPAVPSPFGFGFQPFGFYQPYGAHYQSRIATPPYFSLNPPVYYGARHARPYGISPFASPPVVTPAANYRSRLRSDFLEPRVPTPGPASRFGVPTIGAPCGNPFCGEPANLESLASTQSDEAGPAPVMSVEGRDRPAAGVVRHNPFVASEIRVAAK